MRYRTNQRLLIEAETSLDIIRCLRDASWNDQKLSDVPRRRLRIACTSKAFTFRRSVLTFP